MREVVHLDSATGEKHVADVKTQHGVVIGFQNSPISTCELRARELFYGRMLWVVNGGRFAAQFTVLHALPDPRSEFARDLVFYPATSKRPTDGLFYRKSENVGKKPGDLVLVHSISGLRSEIEREYIGHHQFEWIRPQTVWFESTAPVFLDFGSDILWRLQEYDETIKCVQRVPKKQLVQALL